MADDFLTEYMDALAHGLATCAALAGARPVRDLAGDVTDDLLASPDAGLQRLEWGMAGLRERVADGRVYGGPPPTDEQINRVRRLRAAVACASPDTAALAAECIADVAGPDWRTKFTSG